MYGQLAANCSQYKCCSQQIEKWRPAENSVQNLDDHCIMVQKPTAHDLIQALNGKACQKQIASLTKQSAFVLLKLGLKNWHIFASGIPHVSAGLFIVSPCCQPGFFRHIHACRQLRM